MPINAPTMAEVEAARRGRSFPKGASRLQDTTAQDKADAKADEKFRRDIFRLDKGICRRCLRKVERKLDRVADRAEVHHVAGRGGALRWELRNGLLTCAECHEQITGRVNERIEVIGTKHFRLAGKRLINARAPVTFRKVA